MLRINLLPGKKKRQVKTDILLLMLMILVLLVELVVCFQLYSSVSSKFKTLNSQNITNQKELDKFKDKERQLTERNRLTQDLVTKAEVIQKLEIAKTGPVRILDELVEILTQHPKNSERYRNQQKRGWQADWNPKRVWLNSFVEKNKELTIAGGAKENDDIAEFVKRLNTSKFFKNVRLGSTEEKEHGNYGLKYNAFNLTCNIEYNI